MLASSLIVGLFLWSPVGVFLSVHALFPLCLRACSVSPPHCAGVWIPVDKRCSFPFLFILPPLEPPLPVLFPSARPYLICRWRQRPPHCRRSGAAAWSASAAWGAWSPASLMRSAPGGAAAGGRRVGTRRSSGDGMTSSEDHRDWDECQLNSTQRDSRRRPEMVVTLVSCLHFRSP
ncbi:hypothetical protein PAHAL_7G259700 [Panicum hallii]|uniref:Uncharacterized protein n=1 Tax=Panicum hallii TaxID=206008 RepID=A0A2T8IDJ0_9POAL|nr:hypothetical protein PAHAL_7G259700 [Panicum hallii]